MNTLTETDLRDAGWPPGPELAALLEKAAALEARGIRGRGYLLKLLRRESPPPDQRLHPRSEPAPLAEAIESVSPEDEPNLAAVRRSMRELLRMPVVRRGAVMPDACPVGSAPACIPVGGAVAVEKAIIPSAHSEDVCCSLYATFFRTAAPVEHQLEALKRSTRFGAGGRRKEDWIPHPVLHEPIWDNPFLKGLETHAAMHLADQGDGNHFAWLGKVTVDATCLEALRKAGHHELAAALSVQAIPAGAPGSENPDASAEWHVLVTHHGSRGLGAQVYRRGQKAAEKHTAKVASGIPAAACWLDAESPEGQDYWEALQYVSRWTLANHRCIHEGFAGRLGTTIAAAVGNEHNFVWRRGDLYLHGKGATPAWPDERGRPRLGLIPLHMAAPVLLVIGSANEEYLGFAPHGAGRNRSRRATLRLAGETYGALGAATLDRLVREQAPGLAIHWWHGRPDLTETPLAYKPPAQIRSQLRKFALAEVAAEIQPLGCIMAGDAGPRLWRREDELSPKQIRQIGHRAERRKTRSRLLHADTGEADAEDQES